MEVPDTHRQLREPQLGCRLTLRARVHRTRAGHGVSGCSEICRTSRVDGPEAFAGRMRVPSAVGVRIGRIGGEAAIAGR